jgi:hypothetical protein
MEYLAQSEDLFEKQPAVLARALQVLNCLWDAAPAYQNVTASLRNEPNFWTHICHSLTVDVPRPPRQSAAASAAAGSQTPTRTSSNDMSDYKSAAAAPQKDEDVDAQTNRYCQQLLIRARALQIIALELYNLSPGGRLCSLLPFDWGKQANVAPLLLCAEEVNAPLATLLKTFVETQRHEKVSASFLSSSICAFTHIRSKYL